MQAEKQAVATDPTLIGQPIQAIGAEGPQDVRQQEKMSNACLLHTKLIIF